LKTPFAGSQTRRLPNSLDPKEMSWQVELERHGDRDCLRESTLHAVVQAFPRNKHPIERSLTHPRHFPKYVNYPI
jgi:hypothetical protein